MQNTATCIKACVKLCVVGCMLENVLCVWFLEDAFVATCATEVATVYNTQAQLIELIVKHFSD